MSNWTRVVGCLVVVSVAVVLSLTSGCSGGGTSAGGGTAAAGLNSLARPAIIEITGGSGDTATCAICSRKRGDLVWFHNNTHSPITIVFTGVATGQSSSYKTPFTPEDTLPLTVGVYPNDWSPGKVIRGPNASENNHIYNFLYTVNGKVPVWLCMIGDHPMPGDPGVTVDD